MDNFRRIPKSWHRSTKCINEILFHQKHIVIEKPGSVYPELGFHPILRHLNDGSPLQIIARDM